MPKPQFWYPLLRLGSQHRMPKRLFVFGSGRAPLTLLSLLGDTCVPEVPVTIMRVSAPAPFKNPTVMETVGRFGKFQLLKVQEV